MGGAIGLAATNNSKKLIEELWKKVGVFETTPTMKALNYPPHITLAMYPKIEMLDLRNVAKSIFKGRKKLTITFREIRYFENNPLVLYASPSDVVELTDLHSRVHSTINPLLCEEHYRPDEWVAHCTLGTHILDEKRDVALAFAQAPFEPIEVEFDVVDCLHYPPITLTERICLMDG